MKISSVLSGKSRHDVVTISPDATVRDLVAALADANVGALVVSGDGRDVDGIVSERDVVRHLHSGSGGLLDQAVSSIMTSVVATCSPSDSVDELMALMTQKRIRHVPVVDDEGLAGIISIGDVVKSRIETLVFERDQLDEYVHQS